jgi:hypothetical protein
MTNQDSNLNDWMVDQVLAAGDNPCVRKIQQGFYVGFGHEKLANAEQSDHILGLIESGYLLENEYGDFIASPKFIRAAQMRKNSRA